MAGNASMGARLNIRSGKFRWTSPQKRKHGTARWTKFGQRSRICVGCPGSAGHRLRRSGHEPPLHIPSRIVSAVIGGQPSAEDAIGPLSLVLWSLVVTVSVKYCSLVMRADNNGEGGIMALMALVTRDAGGGTTLLALMGLFGAALLYGDGVITPAISVLSALEGVNVATDILKPYVLPASLIVLFSLFVAQVRGTAAIGRVFGPVMLLWFLTIGLLGFLQALHEPRVLLALNPLSGVGFVMRHGMHSFIILGGVFLAVTGGEALYADMGSLGRGPIRFGWYALVLPALLLCYAGQTALLIRNPKLDGNPFLLSFWRPIGRVVPLVSSAGNLRDHNRKPGDHYGHLFFDPPGNATRLDAGAEHPADIR